MAGTGPGEPAGGWPADIPVLRYHEHLFLERQIRSVTPAPARMVTSSCVFAADHRLRVVTIPYPLIRPTRR
jgi:hypothetical protein